MTQPGQREAGCQAVSWWLHPAIGLRETFCWDFVMETIHGFSRWNSMSKGHDHHPHHDIIIIIIIIIFFFFFFLHKINFPKLNLIFFFVGCFPCTFWTFRSTKAGFFWGGTATQWSRYWKPSFAMSFYRDRISEAFQKAKGLDWWRWNMWLSVTKEEGKSSMWLCVLILFFVSEKFLFAG